MYMCFLLLYIAFTISVASDSLSDLVNGTNNTFEYADGVHFNLTCLVAPVPLPKTVYLYGIVLMDVLVIFQWNN